MDTVYNKLIVCGRKTTCIVLSYAYVYQSTVHSSVTVSGIVLLLIQCCQSSTATQAIIELVSESIISLTASQTDQPIVYSLEEDKCCIVKKGLVLKGRTTCLKHLAAELMHAWFSWLASPYLYHTAQPMDKMGTRKPQKKRGLKNFECSCHVVSTTFAQALLGSTK